jgi:hypothetical protein
MALQQVQRRLGPLALRGLLLALGPQPLDRPLVLVGRLEPSRWS